MRERERAIRLTYSVFVALFLFHFVKLVAQKAWAMQGREDLDTAALGLYLGTEKCVQILNRSQYVGLGHHSVISGDAYLTRLI